MPTREELFEAHRPTFSDRQSTRFFDAHGGEIVSVEARRGVPDYVVVAFATQTEHLGPISLNPVVVARLRHLLDQLASSQSPAKS
jgi:hypothetical protein